MSKTLTLLFYYTFLVSFAQMKERAIKKKQLTVGIDQVTINGCLYELKTCGQEKALPILGSQQNPAPSCKAIQDKYRSATSGPYYIQTNPTVTKVYCYMEDVPGCGGGGWTTIMKTDGNKSTFRYESAFWSNKNAYHVDGGQTGVDEQETKLPIYWTLPFSRLCLGMKAKNQKHANWIHLSYTASSLYSLIADGRYRGFSIGRSQWKSLITGSSLQPHCSREGFNNLISGNYLEWVRIGIIANQENDCGSPDSAIGFGAKSMHCSEKVNTGNCAVYKADNGDQTIMTHGYILAQ